MTKRTHKLDWMFEDQREPDGKAGLHAVRRDVSFPRMEERILDIWVKERVFEHSVEARKGGPRYVFYDGPPFATGLPHYGHIMTSFIKDVVPRYYTMRGYYVPRRWGWDCHGLPVEYEVEKDLEIDSRADVLRLGVGTFNDACRNTVLRYSQEWKTIIDRLGRWVDFDSDYKTMDRSYMESVLWCFKRLHELGLTYQGEKVVPYCIRCQTVLSNFEARLDDAFRPRQDPSITVKFTRSDRSGESFLVWTTTPWTLPSNVALAVRSDLDYVAINAGDGEKLWLAAATLDRHPSIKGLPEVERVKGAALLGVEYVPILPYFAGQKGAFRVIEADFVETDTGTGIVHLAPAFGEEDATACAQVGIQGPNPIQEDGTFDERVPGLTGKTVFDANPVVRTMLKDAGLLFSSESYEHNYPHCWRCDSPLIYRAVNSWFVAASTLRERMLKNNQGINWVPGHIRDGRFGTWLKGARDWAVSRNRFWGAPVPVWICEECATVAVAGSIQEIEERSGREVTSLHRPAIDEHTFTCDDCGGVMRRVPDVLDCWFESGAMPFASVHYPFENRESFESNFPGDFIVEYVAQTRGWFYTLMVLSTALFDKASFRNAVCHGVLLAEDGRKMSKRLRNYPDPLELVSNYGADALRMALLSSAVVRGTDARFSGNAVHEAVRQCHLPLWNGVHMFTSYAAYDRFEPTGKTVPLSRLDRYMLHETEMLRVGLEARMEEYDFPACYELIVDYITLFSTWYIRLTRSIMWESGLDDRKCAVYEVTFAALSTVTKLIAPFVPYLAEGVHLALGGKRSVHLEDWPAPRENWIDAEVSAEMKAIRKVVYLARTIREDRGIKHRHPLQKVSIGGVPQSTIEANLELLTDELRVKEVEWLDSIDKLIEPVVKLNFTVLGPRLRGDMKKVREAVRAREFVLSEDCTRLTVAGHELTDDEFEISLEPCIADTGIAVEGTLVVLLDLEVSDELKAEGMARDLNRRIQNLRKKAGLGYTDPIVLSVTTQGELQQAVSAHREWLAEQCLANRIQDEPLTDPLDAVQFELEGEPVALALAHAPKPVAD
ncbi:MAG: isoleucine--tRNA ligase [Candidatus Hydrogenedentes bacterium]|nr:isoleucine--tRNA ligase [Candidatus Hydrogenedentota bacterium]